jgi:hypothetical protein
MTTPDSRGFFKIKFSKAIVIPQEWIKKYEEEIDSIKDLHTNQSRNLRTEDSSALIVSVISARGSRSGLKFNWFIT